MLDVRGAEPGHPCPAVAAGLLRDAGPGRGRARRGSSGAEHQALVPRPRRPAGRVRAAGGVRADGRPGPWPGSPPCAPPSTPTPPTAAAPPRPFVQPARDRELGNFRAGLDGGAWAVSRPSPGNWSRPSRGPWPSCARRSARRGRTPTRGPQGLSFRICRRRGLGPAERQVPPSRPDSGTTGLAVAARCTLPLVQVTPRGLWGRAARSPSPPSSTGWAVPPARPPPRSPWCCATLAAFGPASVRDMQPRAGLARPRAAFERLHPRLLTFRDPYGVEPFALPDAPRPDPETPAPPASCPSSTTSCSPTPTAPGS